MGQNWFDMLIFEFRKIMASWISALGKGYIRTRKFRGTYAAWGSLLSTDTVYGSLLWKSCTQVAVERFLDQDMDRQDWEGCYTCKERCNGKQEIVGKLDTFCQVSIIVQLPDIFRTTKNAAKMTDFKPPGEEKMGFPTPRNSQGSRCPA